MEQKLERFTLPFKKSELADKNSYANIKNLLEKKGCIVIEDSENVSFSFDKSDLLLVDFTQKTLVDYINELKQMVSVKSSLIEEYETIINELKTTVDTSADVLETKIAEVKAEYTPKCSKCGAELDSRFKEYCDVCLAEMSEAAKPKPLIKSDYYECPTYYGCVNSGKACSMCSEVDPNQNKPCMFVSTNFKYTKCRLCKNYDNKSPVKGTWGFMAGSYTQCDYCTSDDDRFSRIENKNFSPLVPSSPIKIGTVNFCPNCKMSIGNGAIKCNCGQEIVE